MITGGILLWGMATYGSGGFIEFFGVPLSEQAFVGLCLVWFYFDMAAYRRARSAERTESAGTAPAAESGERAQDGRAAQH